MSVVIVYIFLLVMLVIVYNMSKNADWVPRGIVKDKHGQFWYVDGINETQIGCWDFRELIALESKRGFFTKCDSGDKRWETDNSEDFIWIRKWDWRRYPKTGVRA